MTRRSSSTVRRAHTLVRVAMALVMLVAWSPAWCCCGIRATLGWAGPATSGGETRVVAEAMCPYCAAAAESVAAADAGAQPGRDHGPCRCHDQGREAIAKGNDWAAANDLQGSSLALLVAVPQATAETWSLDAWRPAMAGSARGGPPPPSRSLVSLHCMLTT